MSISLKNILISSICALLVACGGGGGGDDDDSPNLSRIDSTNGVEILEASLSGISEFRVVRRGDDASNAHTQGNISFIRSLIRRQKSADTSNKLGFQMETELCDLGGSIVDDFTVLVDTPPEYEEEGSSVADECVLDFGAPATVTINAEINYTAYDNDNTGAYSQTADGFLIMAFENFSGVPDFSLGFTEFELAESGNVNTNTFNVSKLDYTFEFNDGTTTFFVTSEVTETIVESTGDGCPESGTIVVTGSDNTSVTGTFNGNTIDVSINGNPARTIDCVI